MAGRQESPGELVTHEPGPADNQDGHPPLPPERPSTSIDRFESDVWGTGRNGGIARRGAGGPALSRPPITGVGRRPPDPGPCVEEDDRHGSVTERRSSTRLRSGSSRWRAASSSRRSTPWSCRPRAPWSRASTTSTSRGRPWGAANRVVGNPDVGTAATVHGKAQFTSVGKMQISGYPRHRVHRHRRIERDQALQRQGEPHLLQGPSAPLHADLRHLPVQRPEGDRGLRPRHRQRDRRRGPRAEVVRPDVPRPAEQPLDRSNDPESL